MMMTILKHRTTKTLGLASLLALGLAIGLGDAAFAKQGRGRGQGRGQGGDAKAERVKDKLELEIVDAQNVAPRKARLRIRRKSASQQELRIQLGDAAPGNDLEVWFEDAAGVMTRITAMRESSNDVGDYAWRVRTKKGQALPFGVSDVADLSGRNLEVRSDGGSVVARGTMPDLAPATPNVGKRASVSSPLASTSDDSSSDSEDDSSGDDASSDDDPSNDTVQAEIRLRRKNDREDLKVEVEHAASGLTLSLWIADDADVLTWVGDLHEESDNGDAEYELTLRTDRDLLPFGLDSVAGLSERAVEIRDATGNVLAEGFVPRLGAAPQRAADDDSDDDSDDDDSDDDDSDDDDDTADETIED